MRSFELSVIVYICIISVLMPGCSDESNPAANNMDPRIEGNSYYNPVLNFKLSAPEGWKLSKDVVTNGNTLLLLGEQIENSGSQATFNIVSEYVGTQVNMSGFLLTAKEYIQSTFSNVMFDSERIIILDEFECGKLVYQFRQSGISFKGRQLYFYSNESIIVVTFNSSVSQYDQLTADFDYIQNSLKTIR